MFKCLWITLFAHACLLNLNTVNPVCSGGTAGKGGQRDAEAGQLPRHRVQHDEGLLGAEPGQPALLPRHLRAAPARGLLPVPRQLLLPVQPGGGGGGKPGGAATRRRGGGHIYAAHKQRRYIT